MIEYYVFNAKAFVLEFILRLFASIRNMNRKNKLNRNMP